MQDKDPLYKDIMKNAIKAVSQDSRFEPVDLSELEDLEVTVTILLRSKPVSFSSPQELLNKLNPGKDGVILNIGDNSATYLPDVWNSIPNKIKFLSSLSEKAGLDPDDWKRANIQIYKTILLEDNPKLYAIHNKGFYPASKNKLNNMLENMLKLEEKLPIQAMVVPHAGLQYSGKTAASAYSKINPDNYDKVIVLGPSHEPMKQDMASPGVDLVVTPLGELCVKNIKFIDTKAHDKEHSVKMQLIFIQKILPDAEIYPILVSPKADVKEVAKQVLKLIDDKTLLVVSSDLSHYHSDDEARKIDKNTIKNILKLNTSKEIDACGDAAIKVLLLIANKLNLQPKLVSYTNSGKVSNDLNRVVGYASIVFLK